MIRVLGEVDVIRLTLNPIRLHDIGILENGSVMRNGFKYWNLEWFNSHKGDSIHVWLVVGIV